MKKFKAFAKNILNAVANNKTNAYLYAMKEKKSRGRPTNESKGKELLVNKTFRIDPEAFERAKENFPRTLNQKVNSFIKRLAKKTKT